MRLAVERGTGTAAQIPGYSIGGKTGTGETGVPARTHVVHRVRGRGRGGAAEARDRRRAAEPERHGGTTAAPIAREVMQAILQGTENP